MAVEEMVMDGRRNRRMDIIGIDANAILGDGAPSDRVNIIGDYGFGRRSDRGDHFASWLHGVNLAAVATMWPRTW